MSNFIITALFLLLYFGATLWLLPGMKWNTKELCIGGLCVALTMMLETIPIPLPTGAHMPLVSMVPLMLLAIVCDYRLAFVSGWACGFLAMFLILRWHPVHWGQFFVEHMVCFSCMGYVGVFGSDSRAKVVGGMLLASVLKILGHLISGVLFFSKNAWAGWGAWGYSLAYNLSQNVPLCLLSAVIVLALPLKTIQTAIRKE